MLIWGLIFRVREIWGRGGDISFSQNLPVLINIKFSCKRIGQLDYLESLKELV